MRISDWSSDVCSSDLYQSDDVQLISMKSFVPNLLTHLSHTLDDRSAEILIETEVDDIFLTMDETIPLAQLMTEAVSNSLKHAFRSEERREGKGCASTGRSRRTPVHKKKTQKKQ